MCYGYHRVRDHEGKLWWVSNKDFVRLEREGTIKSRPDGLVFARSYAPVIVAGGEVRSMRFDFVPEFLALKYPDLTVKEIIKEKQSQRKGSAGFDSYNAQSEGLLERRSFADSWRKRRRGLIVMDAFRERPNEDYAPSEYRGKQYTIHLKIPFFGACIYDSWTHKGVLMESFALLTVSSAGNSVLERIYHPRCPVLLAESNARKWIDPNVSMEEAWDMCKLLPASIMRAVLVTGAQKEEEPEEQEELEA